MVEWSFISQDDYNNLREDQKTTDKLFYISGSNKIYRGKRIFSEPVFLIDDKPLAPLSGAVYILNDTLEGFIFNGVEWIQVIKPAVVLKKKSKLKSVSTQSLDEEETPTDDDLDGLRSAISTMSDNNSMPKVDKGKDGEILVANDDGSSRTSGFTIGSAVTMGDSDTAVATERGVSVYIDKSNLKKSDVTTSDSIAHDVSETSDDKTMSEKSIASMLSWKTVGDNLLVGSDVFLNLSYSDHTLKNNNNGSITVTADANGRSVTITKPGGIRLIEGKYKIKVKYGYNGNYFTNTSATCYLYAKGETTSTSSFSITTTDKEFTVTKDAQYLQISLNLIGHYDGQVITFYLYENA